MTNLFLIQLSGVLEPDIALMAAYVLKSPKICGDGSFTHIPVAHAEGIDAPNAS